MKEKRNDLISGIIFLAFAVFIYVFSFKIQQTTSDILGSRFFPQAVAILIAILAIVQIFGAVKNLKVAAPAAKTDEAAPGKKKVNWPLWLTSLALLLYWVVIPKLGFVVTSIIYLLFECTLLMSTDQRKNKKDMIIMGLVAIVLPIALNFVFWNIFSIRLPQFKLF